MFFHVRPILSGVIEASKDKWVPGVATFPKFPVAGAVGTGTSGYAASAKTQYPKDAAALVLFIASPEGQKVFSPLPATPFRCCSRSATTIRALGAQHDDQSGRLRQIPRMG